MYHLKVEISRTEPVDLGDFGTVAGGSDKLVSMECSLCDPRDLAGQLEALAAVLTEWEQ